MQVLDNIIQDNQQKAECQQVRGLLSTMTKLETGFMIVFWNQILQRFQLTSDLAGLFWVRPELCLCTLRINLWLYSVTSFVSLIKGN